MKIIKLTESDLTRIVKSVIKEQSTLPFKTKEEGNSFRKWLNDNYPGIAKSFELDRVGSHTNSYIKNAFNSKIGKTARTWGQFYLTTIARNTAGKSTTTAPKATETSAAKTVAKNETGTDAVLNPNASLSFDGDKVHWVSNGKIIKSWSAVSGLTWKNTPVSDWGQMLKRYTTSPQEWSQDKNAGPLPEGAYVVGPLETRTGDQEEIGALEAFWNKLTGKVSDNDADRSFSKDTVLSRISWGNYRAVIRPTGGQKMYNRGGFYIHGGSLRGSHGCIDLTDDMADFAKFFGIWTAATKKRTISLNVKYNTPLINQVIQKLVNL
jgi:hypothetical protein